MRLPDAPPVVESAGSAAQRPPGVPDHPMHRWIGLVLRGGVTVAGALVLLGLTMALGGQWPGGEVQTVAGLIAAERHVISPAAIAAGVAEGRPTAIVRLGVLALILTPISRVAMTVVLFAAQRDWFFVAIALVVLTVLGLGLLGFGA
ncbi:MAG: DUF1634 domain-containing protein [Thermomicrobiales bacterium]|nr:DUF1634 domain-containing protein [Thermomicrobiales bacterium]